MKQMTIGSRSKQGGFSLLAIILVVVAIVAALGVWAMSGQSNTSSSAASSNSVTASSIINDSSSVKDAFDSLLVGGNVATAITFIPNTAGLTNMLDPTTGIQKPTPSSSAVGVSVYPQGQWTYQTGLKIMNVGSSAAENALVLPDVKDAVCAQINSSMYGTGTATPVSGVAESAFTTGGTALAPSSAAVVDMSAVVGVNGWMSGCVSATGGTVGASNVYFRVLKAS